MPDEVVLPMEPEGSAGIAEWLGELRGKAVQLVVKPEAGSASSLLAMAMENARHAFREKRMAVASAGGQAEALARALNLDAPPHTIECVDISHHAGAETVGAVVSLLDGVPNKPGYRGFHVRTEQSGDDYAAMYEVLSRRFRRGKNAERGWDLPDLFVIDGGRGQLQVAVAVLKELGLGDVALCSLAKERENVLGEKVVDRVYQPGRKNPVTIRDNGPALVLLARARDEAHRFANRVRERLHHKKRLRSALDDARGIGPQAAKVLLRHFGSVTKVAEASLGDLAAVPGVGKRSARAVYEHLHPGVLQLPEHDDG